jgi:hypothetical protein
MNQSFPTAKALVEHIIGRTLKPLESVRFKNKNKREIVLENLLFRSPKATAHEKFLVTGFVPGYSHCLCGCGESLGNPNSEEFRQANPKAFVEGHSPAEKDIKKIRNTVSDLAKKPVGWPKGKPRGRKGGRHKGQPLNPDHPAEVWLKQKNAEKHPLEPYRLFFTKYIGQLPTEKFVKLIDFMNSPDF